MSTRRNLRRACLALLLLASLAGAQGRDWFVRAGSSAGDGSRERPYSDPWEALERCEAGDRIHVAAGAYYGRFGAGTWVIPFDRVELLGGYDAGFAGRDPWKHHAKLCWDARSPNWPKQERVSSTARDVVVDGLVVDMRDQNGYVDAAGSARSAQPGQSAMRFANAAAIRNCLILNPGIHGIDCGAGSTIENNLIVNAIEWALKINSSSATNAVATVRDNTILFCWDTQKPGGGGYGGAAISLNAPAAITGNLLGWCDNNAVYLTGPRDKVAITGNRFFANRFSNVRSLLAGSDAIAADDSMEILEELGLAAWAGNTSGDPKLPLDPAWLALAGRGEAKPREEGQGLAPAMSIDAALALVRAADAAAAPGARVRKLEPAYRPAAAAEAAKAYAASELLAWCRAPQAVSGQRVEMVVALGSVANVSGMPAEYPRATLGGVFLYDPEGKGERITGFYVLGSAQERACNQDMGRYQGTGKPPALHRVRGIAYAVASVPKAALCIESIERWEAPLAEAAPRPAGRDWFVCAGASGGDGSREKPFRDPYQALERCEPGDTVHVAEGEYHGKLKAGAWKIAKPQVALLGGYDAEFRERDPWTRPTRLLCPAEYKGRRGGYTLEGEDDHGGAIVDGFVFDKRLNNVYGPGGGITRGSDTSEHLWLARPGCVIRNCVFANGACGALRVANGQLIENNVFVNHVTQVIDVARGFGTDPVIVRRNTIAFSWDHRPGLGRGANGHLLHLGGDVRAVIEDNVFAYADNDAIRLDADPRGVTLRGNVFFRNLWSNVQQMSGSTTFADANWERLGELGWKACERNAVLDPNLALDAPWLEAHAKVRSGAPAAAAREPAAPEPPRNPFDDPPPGSGAARSETRVADSGRNPFDDGPRGAATEDRDSGIARAYDAKAALAIVPREPGCVAGARPVPLSVSFGTPAQVR